MGVLRIQMKNHIKSKKFPFLSPAIHGGKGVGFFMRLEAIYIFPYLCECLSSIKPHQPNETTTSHPKVPITIFVSPASQM